MFSYYNRPTVLHEHLSISEVCVRWFPLMSTSNLTQIWCLSLRCNLAIVKSEFISFKDEMWLYRLGMRCGYTVWGWDVAIPFGDEIWLYRLKMRCGYISAISIKNSKACNGNIFGLPTPSSSSSNSRLTWSRVPHSGMIIKGALFVEYLLNKGTI